MMDDLGTLLAPEWRCASLLCLFCVAKYGPVIAGPILRCKIRPGYCRSYFALQNTADRFQLKVCLTYSQDMHGSNMS